jgi:hypothetical protein
MREACVAALQPVLERLSGIIDEKDLALMLPHLTRLRRILDEDRSQPAEARIPAPAEDAR